MFDNTDGMGYAVSPFAGMPKTYDDLAKYMSASWASFISDLDPNAWLGSDVMNMTPEWPAFDHSGPKNIVWDGNSTALAEVERNTFRTDGIRLITANFEKVYNAWVVLLGQSAKERTVNNYIHAELIFERRVEEIAVANRPFNSRVRVVFGV